MDNFDLSEQKGRSLWESFCNQSKAVSNLQFTTGKMNSIDCTFELHGKVYAGEIKVRSIDCVKYCTLFMEEDKYNALKQYPNAVYINFIDMENGEYQLFIFDVNKLGNCLKKVVHCNKTTAVYSGKKDKVMLDINKGLAKRYNFNGDWKRVN